ncbi:MAG: transporter, partial [Humidesulfovibrio sp.]|nr:transporter [Humidesulfovibrio sp.]
MHPLKRVRSRLLVAAALALAALLAVGCSLAPKYERPSPVLPGDWTSGAGPRAQANATLPDWRQVISDPAMQKLIELALANN